MTASFTLLLPMLSACFATMLVPNLLRHPPFMIHLRQRTLKEVGEGILSRIRLFQCFSCGLKSNLAAHARLCVSTVFITLDIEYPRAGLMRVDAFDHARVELRRSVK
jgi:hypothetical protein